MPTEPAPSIRYVQTISPEELRDPTNWILLRHNDGEIHLGIIRFTLGLGNPRKVVGSPVKVASSGEITRQGVESIITVDVVDYEVSQSEIASAMQLKIGGDIERGSIGQALTKVAGFVHPAAAIIDAVASAAASHIKFGIGKEFNQRVENARMTRRSEQIRVPAEQDNILHACRQYTEFEIDIFVRSYDYLVVAVKDGRRRPECYPSRDAPPRSERRHYKLQRSEISRNILPVLERKGCVRYLVPTGFQQVLYQQELDDRRARGEVCDPESITFVPGSGQHPRTRFSLPPSLHEIARTGQFQRAALDYLDSIRDRIVERLVL